MEAVNEVLHWFETCPGAFVKFFSFNIDDMNELMRQACLDGGKLMAADGYTKAY
jgi:hypothetical protein